MITQADAIATFRRYGASDADLVSHAALKSIWHRLMAHLHPDHGGSAEAAKILNAAYDVLRRAPRLVVANPAPPATPAPPAEDDLRWAYAGWTAVKPPQPIIRRADCTDANFVRRLLWRLSGGSTTPYKLYTYSGASFESSLTSYGSPAIYADMARAMLDYGRAHDPIPPRAIFAKVPGSQTMLLLWADGRLFAEPLAFETRGYPGNSQTLRNDFNRRLDALKYKRAA